jgi:hypothetical protein
LLSVHALSETQAMADHSIEISTKGKWIKVPAVNVNGSSVIVRGKWLKVATVHDEAWLQTEISEPATYLAALKENSLNPDIFSFAQKLPGSKPKHEFPLEWESIAVIYFATFKEWWEKLPQETRKNVRRSQKRGVVIKVQNFDDNLLAGIEDVNNDSLARQGERNYYYGRSRDQLRKDYSAFLDRSDFVCAYLGDEMIGFLKVVYRGEVASILNLTPKSSQSDKRPANALIAKAVELCEAKGISYLTYGMYNYGNKGDSPLREFKTRNGFEEVLTPRFYVPLTRWGWFCLKLQLHRGILGILPHAAIMTLLDVRARWRRFEGQWISRCSSMPERPNRNRQMERSNPPAGSNS